MALIRWKDEQGKIVTGLDQGDGTALQLEGSISGGFTPTGRKLRVGALLAPLIPTNILGIGLNYRAHVNETAAPETSFPVLFMKSTSSVNDPFSPIVIPKVQLKGPEVDFEGELAVIIGKPLKNATAETALGAVFGYTCANDVSARRWQKHAGASQWVRAKSFDSFCPLGPRIVTADEIGDPQCLSIATTLNGQLVQQSNTSQMIFSIVEILMFLSQDTTLLPGTVVLTGTPEGVGYTRTPPLFLKDGDRVSVTIEKIGTLENPVTDAQKRG